MSRQCGIKGEATSSPHQRRNEAGMGEGVFILDGQEDRRPMENCVNNYLSKDWRILARELNLRNG